MYHIINGKKTQCFRLLFFKINAKSVPILKIRARLHVINEGVFILKITFTELKHDYGIAFSVNDFPTKLVLLYAIQFSVFEYHVCVLLFFKAVLLVQKR